MTMHDGIIAQSKRFKKAIASKDVSSYKVVYPGQLVVGFPIDEGVIYVQGFDHPGIMSPAYSIWDIDTNVIDPDYLELALHGPSCMAYYADKMRGTTARRRTLTSENLTAMSVPLPDGNQQNRIVDIFGTVRAQINARRRQLSLLDDLVKSRFVEMFGDPDLKDRGFETARGKDLFKIGNGKSRPVSKRFDEGIPAYGGNGVSWYTDDALVDFDTIVIGRVGRHCGNTRLVEAPFWVTDNAMYIKKFTRDCFDNVFLIYLMNIIAFNRFADAGDLWKITQKPFMEYEFPIPPLSLQREFVAFVERVDKSRVVVQQQVLKYNDVIRASSETAIIRRGGLA